MLGVFKKWTGLLNDACLTTHICQLFWALILMTSRGQGGLGNYNKQESCKAKQQADRYSMWREQQVGKYEIWWKKEISTDGKQK